MRILLRFGTAHNLLPAAVTLNHKRILGIPIVVMGIEKWGDRFGQIVTGSPVANPFITTLYLKREPGSSVMH